MTRASRPTPWAGGGAARGVFVFSTTDVQIGPSLSISAAKVELQWVECTKLSKDKLSSLPTNRLAGMPNRAVERKTGVCALHLPLGTKQEKKKVNSRFGISFVLFITLFLLRPITFDSTIHFFSFSFLPLLILHSSSLLDSSLFIKVISILSLSSLDSYPFASLVLPILHIHIATKSLDPT